MRDSFRLDINALRALSVVSVLLFHFGVSPFHGGFVGVDVFFVISGFLMTTIVFNGLEKGTFSIWGFYLARFRRIFPALFFMCGIVVLLNIVLVDPITATDTARNAFYSLLFVSNIPYAFENSYFAQSSESNWLLHTWTLSVEWQFYILFPIFIAVLWRWQFFRRYRFPIAASITVLMMIATFLVSRQSNATFQVSFFLLPTRAWELLAGSCIALAPPIRFRGWWARGLSIAAILSLILCACTIDNLTPWPSPWTLWPVAAAALFLAINYQGGAWVRAIPIQKLGTWSYSIYLWHWPVVVASAYFFPQRGYLVSGLGIALGIALGAVSYTLVETRLRDLIFAPRRSLTWRLALPVPAVAAVFLVCLFAWKTGGFEAFRLRHFPTETREALADYRQATADWSGKSACGPNLIDLFGGGHICRMGGTRNEVAVIGDSHVEQLLPRYQKLLAGQSGQSITFMYKDGCAPVPNLDLNVPGFNCSSFMKRMFQLVKREKYQRLVLISSWSTYFQKNDGSVSLDQICFRNHGPCQRAPDLSAYEIDLKSAFDDLARELADLNAHGIEVVVVRQNPILDGDTARDLYRKTFLTRSTVRAMPIDIAELKARTKFTRDQLSRLSSVADLRLVDPLNYLCAPDRCDVYDGGQYVYKDGNHIRRSLIGGERYAFFDQLLFNENAALTDRRQGSLD